MYLKKFKEVPRCDYDFTYYLHDEDYGQVYYGLEEIRIRLCELNVA